MSRLKGSRELDEACLLALLARAAVFNERVGAFALSDGLAVVETDADGKTITLLDRLPADLLDGLVEGPSHVDVPLDGIVARLALSTRRGDHGPVLHAECANGADVAAHLLAGPDSRD